MINIQPRKQTPGTLSFDNTKIAFASKNNAQLRTAFILFKAFHYTWILSLGNKVVLFGVKYGLPITWLVKKTAFAQFCGGETIKNSERTIRELYEFNVGSILDYSVEGSDSEAQYESTFQELLATIDKGENDDAVPFSVFKVTALSRVSLLMKVQEGQSLSNNEEVELENTRRRVREICETAASKNVKVFIDAEESWIQEPIDTFALEMMELYNQNGVIVYNTYQFYRHDKLEDFKRDVAFAKEKGFILGAKLVRGAYMEKERARAKNKGYKSPIQPDKESTDRDYNIALEHAIKNIDHVAICAGTHNEFSNLYLTKLMKDNKISGDNHNIYFSQLYGMSDHISFNLSEAGYNVAKYVPYGPIKEVLPYLIRRSEENSAISGMMGRELSLIVREIERRKRDV
ncbi:MAG: proline dehydrogenase [Sphingobacteriales bacterium]|jgi:proline dehydrogenase